jgi:hypothetical protein
MNGRTMLAVLALGVSVLLGGCATQPPVKYDYTAYKASKPHSIVVLPPLNQSPDVGAATSVLAVSTVPLAEAGYYVLPVALVSETFKQNGISEATDAQEVPVAKLREIFGADAAMYVTVTKYGTSFRLLDSVVEVALSARLVDLRTGEELWHGAAQASSAEQQNQNQGGLIGALVGAVLKQIINSTHDSGYRMAAVATQRLYGAGHPGGLLYGPYHPKFGTD